MSIQQCYELFFNQKDPLRESSLNDYKIYSYLIRFGYILRRTTPKEPKISIQKENSKFQTEIIPVINRTEIGTMQKEDIFQRLNNLIPNTSLDQIRSKILNNQKKSIPNFRVMYNVYMPNKSFKKSQPGKAIFSLWTRINWQNDQKLILPTLNDLTSDQSEFSNLFAFVNDANDVMFYSFNQSISLPFLTE